MKNPGCNEQSEPPSLRRGECASLGLIEYYFGGGKLLVLRNKKTFLVPLEAWTLPTGLTAEGNLFVPRGSVCKRKTELSAEKETMSVWGNLGQCFPDTLPEI